MQKYRGSRRKSRLQCPLTTSPYQQLTYPFQSTSYRSELLLSAARVPNLHRKVVAVRLEADHRSLHHRPPPRSLSCRPPSSARHRPPNCAPVPAVDQQRSPTTISVHPRLAAPATVLTSPAAPGTVLTSPAVPATELGSSAASTTVPSSTAPSATVPTTSTAVRAERSEVTTVLTTPSAVPSVPSAPPTTAIVTSTPPSTGAAPNCSASTSVEPNPRTSTSTELAGPTSTTSNSSQLEAFRNLPQVTRAHLRLSAERIAEVQRAIQQLYAPGRIRKPRRRRLRLQLRGLQQLLRTGRICSVTFATPSQKRRPPSSTHPAQPFQLHVRRRETTTVNSSTSSSTRPTTCIHTDACRISRRVLIDVNPLHQPLKATQPISLKPPHNPKQSRSTRTRSTTCLESSTYSKTTKKLSKEPQETNKKSLHRNPKRVHNRLLNRRHNRSQNPGQNPKQTQARSKTKQIQKQRPRQTRRKTQRISHQWQTHA
ncbi:hypothetical protein AAVH_20702 [Aphelenchoides avenae]|nr:hypothetical protein AAVH_20702 [Aphelenchus avenae]